MNDPTPELRASPAEMSKLARRLATLSPGDAASLRRNPLDSAVYWGLEFAALGGSDWAVNEKADVVKAVAILTPRGSIGRKFDAYDTEVSFGAALLRSGVSFSRVGRMLDNSMRVRVKSVITMCRMIRSRGACTQFRLEEMADLILTDDRKVKRKVLADYNRVSQIIQEESNR